MTTKQKRKAAPTKHSKGTTKDVPALNKPKRTQAIEEKPVSQGRHEFQCSICAHPQRDEIEVAFVNWRSPARIAKEYLVSRDSIYRHARALGLMEKRRRNVRAALERIIEKAGEVDASAAAVVSAVVAYAKINAAGQYVERSETVNLNELFERMSLAELEAYARDGSLPAWFTGGQPETETAAGSMPVSICKRLALAATAPNSQEDKDRDNSEG